MKQDLSVTCRGFFATLANPARLAILELLRTGPRNVTEIAHELKQEQSMISHNLRPLETCRFVFVERRKKERYYYLNKETMERVFKIFEFHSEKFCPTEGKCLTDSQLKKQKHTEALSPLYLSRE